VTERMSTIEWLALQGKQKINKYGNKRVVVDGWPFDSQLEADHYVKLKLLREAGAILWFICQVPFRLPGGIIYKADFLRVNSPAYIAIGGPAVEIEDTKGAMTRVAINKIKQVEELYGIKVTLIRRKRR
jgi:Protein of unknown function (DUF1064)